MTSLVAPNIGVQIFSFFHFPKKFSAPTERLMNTHLSKLIIAKLDDAIIFIIDIVINIIEHVLTIQLFLVTGQINIRLTLLKVTQTFI